MRQTQMTLPLLTNDPLGSLASSGPSNSPVPISRIPPALIMAPAAFLMSLPLPQCLTHTLLAALQILCVLTMTVTDMPILACLSSGLLS